MNELKNYKLSEVTDGIYDGPHATPAKANSGGIFLGIKNITENGQIDLTDTYFISETDLKKWTKRVKPKFGDLVFSYEATLHRYALIPENFYGCLGRRMALIRPNKDLLDVKYLFYLFLSPSWKSFIEANQVSGATVDRIPLIKFPDYKIQLPLLPKQQKISSILSAYDDLIEVNSQRIKTLEETASQLYKEWFVRMRFPGYKQRKFEKGIPKGWEIQKVKLLLNRHKFGRTYRPDELHEVGAVVVIDQSTDQLLGYHNNKADHLASAANPMIIFGDHTCKMQLMVEPFSLAENVVPISAKRGMPIYFLYYLIESLVETTEYKRHWNELISKSVLVPESDLQIKYSDIVKPFFEQINLLKKQNVHLSKIRDRLLPRLISGKLQVQEETKTIKQSA